MDVFDFCHSITEARKLFYSKSADYFILLLIVIVLTLIMLSFWHTCGAKKNNIILFYSDKIIKCNIAVILTNNIIIHESKNISKIKKL